MLSICWCCWFWLAWATSCKHGFSNGLAAFKQLQCHTNYTKLQHFGIREERQPKTYPGFRLYTWSFFMRIICWKCVLAFVNMHGMYFIVIVELVIAQWCFLFWFLCSHLFVAYDLKTNWFGHWINLSKLPLNATKYHTQYLDLWYKQCSQLSAVLKRCSRSFFYLFPSLL